MPGDAVSEKVRSAASDRCNARVRRGCGELRPAGGPGAGLAGAGGEGWVVRSSVWGSSTPIKPGTPAVRFLTSAPIPPGGHSA